MSYKDFLKLERFPTTWCPGCGIGLVMKAVAELFLELGFSREDTIVVSGIGCSGRAAGYFSLDTAHGLHGRALPLAEGIKRANKKLNVVVISGDGDLTGIGGNHLLHSSRRNIDLTVICINNETYGMTGGQMAPTTKKGIVTLTSPLGNDDEPINIQGIVTAHPNHFYSRNTIFHLDHMKNSIRKAIQHKGFSFVDIICDCITNYGKRQGFKTAYDMLKSYKDFYKVNSTGEKLKDDEIGIVTNKVPEPEENKDGNQQD
jgi:2-oxoglutarate ferredoxin oxidoreductase subunit beta